MARGRGRGAGRGRSRGGSSNATTTQSGKKKKEYLKQKKQQKLERAATESQLEREAQYAKYNPPMIVSVDGVPIKEEFSENQQRNAEHADLVRRVNRHGQVNRLTTIFERQSDEDVLARKADSDRPLDTTPRNFPLTAPVFHQIGFPIRPPWNSSDSKAKIDASEELYFSNWLEHVYTQVRDGVKQNHVASLHTSDVLSPFEHNLEVWRQLWRVVERSDMLLLCADVRCATLHIPVDFYRYITSDLGKPLVIVLTKVDLVEQSLVEKWKRYLAIKFPKAHVTQFAAKATSTNGTGGVATRRKAITKKATKADMEVMHNSANDLIATCVEVYTSHLENNGLIVPQGNSGEEQCGEGASTLMPVVQNATGEVRFNPTSSNDKQEVIPDDSFEGLDSDGGEVSSATGQVINSNDQGSNVDTATQLGDCVDQGCELMDERGRDTTVASDGIQNIHIGDSDPDKASDSTTRNSSSNNNDHEQSFDMSQEYQVLRSSTKPAGVPTIGFVGQPNVGKSSLLNCLVGKHVVSVSRSCGHTKYLQTYLVKKPRDAGSNASHSRLLAACAKLDSAANATDAQDPTLSERVVAELCDCPGLIFPVASFNQGSNALRAQGDFKLPSPRAIFECNGLYPISQIREPYSAIRFLAERVELERLYNIKLDEEDYGPQWSPYALCGTLADKKGYKVSNGRGAPDFHRAGLEILRDTVDGYVLLAFEPPLESVVTSDQQ